MPSNIDELLELLYTEIEEAKSPAFNGDKAVIDRDRVLDMIDDVKAEIPVEVKRAHAQFRSALSNLEPEKKQEPRPQPNRRPMYDAELDED